MTIEALRRLFAAYAVLLFVLFLGVNRWASLSPVRGLVVESTWRGGVRTGRIVREGGATATAQAADETVVEEHVVGRGPLAHDGPFFALGLVAGMDGFAATLDGRVAYVTVDDLLHAQAYDHGATFLDPSLGLGTHRAVAFHLLANELGVPVRDVEQRARLERVRFERHVASEPPAPRITEETLTREVVLRGIDEAAHYLARNVDREGSFRYLVDATTNQTVPGYSWPRHAGATFFLAQAAKLLDSPDVRFAALRAAARMRDDYLVTCGKEQCITDWEQADVGSNALALVAFTELVRTGADASYSSTVRALASFLRSQQRPDGELMHVYDRATGKPLDVQYLYFTGEAALALARAHTVTNDPRDLEAATKALARLVGSGWSFFGSRYYWSEEHWTCQAMDELWARAPSPEALAFCLRWHEYQRALQQGPGDSPFDADGAFGAGPVMTPRLTPAASRGEAAGATLAVVRRASVETKDALAGIEGEEPLLDHELARAVAFLLRHQLVPGRAPMFLFAAPDAIRGALPGSPVDLQLRIDYAQHAGSAMVRWLELHPDR